MNKNSLLYFLLSLVIFASCDFEPKDVSYYIWEEEEEAYGRFLKANTPDNICTDITPDSTKRFTDCSYNLYCTDQSNLRTTSDTLWEENYRKGLYYPIYVHRATGRIETLYKSVYLYGATCIEIGYISRAKRLKDWLIIENRLPGKINGYNNLANEECRRCDIFSLTMSDYNYDGQKKVFESHSSYYWIANKHTTDIFGPLTKSELKSQIQKLGIPLPIKLEGLYDRYSYCRDSDGNILPEPKAFRWPHHQSREDLEIK